MGLRRGIASLLGITARLAATLIDYRCGHAHGDEPSSYALAHPQEHGFLQKRALLGLQAAHQINWTDTTRHRFQQRGLMLEPTEKIGRAAAMAANAASLQYPRAKSTKAPLPAKLTTVST